MTTIADDLIDGVDWAKYDVLSGKATHVGKALHALIHAMDASASSEAYWQLENRVVVQGVVYNSAVPAVRIVVAALLDDPTFPARVAILDLLYQILSGEPAIDGDDVIDQCRLVAREGYWLIVKEYVHGPCDAAHDVLQCLGATDFEYQSLRGGGVI